METRVALISMIVQDQESALEINALLHAYRQYIIGRMGIPYAPQDIISALSGKLGALRGVSAKTVYSKVEGAN